MAEAGSGEKLKVFISYSRRDSSDFADELVAGLELAGFAPFLDRHDIVAGEPWEERLGGLIAQADTVVYVISPEAVKSERCEWEVERAVALSKRVLPVIFKPAPDADIPEQLRRRQFVRFDTGPGITRPLAQLAEALRQDLDWIREHTRLSELASRWDTRSRPESLLLRGDELVAVQAWASSRKPDAPAITDSMRAFIAASKETETAYLEKSRAVQRRVERARMVVVALVAVFGAVMVAGLVAWWQEVWLKDRIYTLVNVHSLKAAQEYGLKPQDTFKECPDCPEMVVVPAGSFMMGSPATEKDRSADEDPQHKVTISKSFAVGKFDVAFDQWDACVSHGYCIPHVSDSGFGRGLRPVINVGWDDAQMYVAWLSRVTGEPYRLLTEAEWEYAARAGAATAYYWGDYIGKGNANCEPCGSQWDGMQTSPVGSFKPNAFGLYDMAGNVFQWVLDCYGNYDDAPRDGSARTYTGCGSRVVRGGSWDDNPQNLRSADRSYYFTDRRESRLGFRVGRTLDSH